MSIDLELLLQNLGNEITEELNSHLSRQPYEAKCNECGSVLDFTVSKVDPDFDAYIDVNPCENCLDELRDKPKDD